MRENVFENVIYKVVVILLRFQYGKTDAFRIGSM